MSEADKTAVAAHLYVTLRRTANRVIDVEWMSKNEEYAREIIQLARAQGSEELARYADRYEDLLFGRAPAPAATPRPAVAAAPTVRTPVTEDTPDDEVPDPDSTKRYIGHLR